MSTTSWILIVIVSPPAALPVTYVMIFTLHHTWTDSGRVRTGGSGGPDFQSSAGSKNHNRLLDTISPN